MDCILTRMCTVEYIVCVCVELFPEDGAIVQVTRVDEALGHIFEQQVALTKLLGLKELEVCVCAG